MTLPELLAEPIATARQREASAYSFQFNDKLVLFGAGQLGKKMLRVLRNHDIEPLAFVDNDTGLQGVEVDGLCVMSPASAAAILRETAMFVITIFRGTGDAGMASRERQLRDLGCRHVTSFIPLAWKFASELLPHYGATLPSLTLAAAAELAELDPIWCDMESREIYKSQILWRLRGDFSEMKGPSSDQYFPKSLFKLEPNETIVDGGAYDGDTLKLLNANFAKAWAIEPNPNAASQIRANGDPRVTVIECALGDAPDETQFLEENGVASKLNTVSGTRVRIDTLDRILAGESPSFIKLDIEGAEQAALKGARELLGRTGPIVAVCVYHRPDDLWKIPLFLRQTLPGHRLYLRSHQNDGFELVVYAVPPKRAK